MYVSVMAISSRSLLTLAYTCVSAGPSLSGSPLRMMVSELESSGGISTETPVASRISCRVLPFGPMMYLCWDFFTSTEMVVVFRFCEGRQIVLNGRNGGREIESKE